jgi:amino acid transporter
MFFAMGRNGILPRQFARTHPVHRTPYVATLATVLVSLVIALLAGAKWGPLDGFAVLATVYTILLILLYMTVALSSAVFILREHRSQYNVFLHGVIPAVAIGLFGFALYYQYVPLPAAPIVVGDWVAIGWMVAGVLAMAAAIRWLPEKLQRARLVFDDETQALSPDAPARR